MSNRPIIAALGAVLVAFGAGPLIVAPASAAGATARDNNFDVMWVMNQVGHADAKMTTDVCNQLQQRARRQHGEAFDALVRAARERLYGADPGDETATEERSIRTRIREQRRSWTS